MMRSIGLKTIITVIVTSFLFSMREGDAQTLEPKLHYIVQDHYFKSLPAPFEPLKQEEAESDWGKELRIGHGLARQFDLYRAVTALKRAHILAPENSPRKAEMEYTTLLSYYLGKRYKDVDALFTTGTLDQMGPDFTPFHDLLVILYDSYTHLDEEKKAEQLLQLIEHHYPETHQTLIKYNQFKAADLSALPSAFIANYSAHAKSPGKATLFNALLPGLGYFYLGLTHTAITALLLNALFIATTVYFFRKRAWAAAVLFLGFEVGWYIGGVQGGNTQSKLYNERTYEALATPLMNREGLFPIHTLRHGL